MTLARSTSGAWMHPAPPCAWLPRTSKRSAKSAAKCDRHPNATRHNVEIAHRQAFETGALPQKAHAPDLHDVVLQREFAVGIVKIRIGQIEGQRGVVVAGRRTQQHRAGGRRSQETEAGQVARIVEDKRPSGLRASRASPLWSNRPKMSPCLSVRGRSSCKDVLAGMKKSA